MEGTTGRDSRFLEGAKAGIAQRREERARVASPRCSCISVGSACTHLHHGTIGAVVALAHQRRELRLEQVAGDGDVSAGFVNASLGGRGKGNRRQLAGEWEGGLLPSRPSRDTAALASPRARYPSPTSPSRCRTVPSPPAHPHSPCPSVSHLVSGHHGLVEGRLDRVVPHGRHVHPHLVPLLQVPSGRRRQSRNLHPRLSMGRVELGKPARTARL